MDDRLTQEGLEVGSRIVRIGETVVEGMLYEEIKRLLETQKLPTTVTFHLPIATPASVFRGVRNTLGAHAGPLVTEPKPIEFIPLKNGETIYPGAQVILHGLPEKQNVIVEGSKGTRWNKSINEQLGTLGEFDKDTDRWNVELMWLGYDTNGIYYELGEERRHVAMERQRMQLCSWVLVKEENITKPWVKPPASRKRYKHGGQKYYYRRVPGKRKRGRGRKSILAVGPFSKSYLP